MIDNLRKILEQYELLKESCDLYKGHILPKLSGEDRVLMRGAQFQGLYAECFALLTEMMKEKEQYQELYVLRNHAASLYLFDEWQIYAIEADKNVRIHFYISSAASDCRNTWK